MSQKYKKTCKYLNYVKHLLILVSTIPDCVSVSAVASLVCLLVGITNSAVGIKICAIIAVIKNISQLWRNRGISMLRKDKWNTI